MEILILIYCKITQRDFNIITFLATEFFIDKLRLNTLHLIIYVTDSGSHGFCDRKYENEAIISFQLIHYIIYHNQNFY